jgi:HYDIN/CFA65/VesB family protein/centrosomal CEP192-like protein/ASPM-SPD-2-Hydin domain-containing protein
MRNGHAQTVSARTARARRNLEKSYAVLLIALIAPLSTFLNGCAGFANGANKSSSAAFQLSPSSVSFGQVVVGKQATQAVSISNTGKAALNITQLTLSNSHFSVAGVTTPMSLAIGQTGTFNVTVNASATGTLTGTLTAQAVGVSQPAVISLSATAVSSQPQISVNPTNINFGTVSTGLKANSNLLITNAGANDLTISVLALSGADFGLSGITTPKTISAGQSAQVALTFSPAASGSATGTLSITSNDPTNPTVTIPVTGTGTMAATGQLTANPANLSFGMVSTGASANKQVVLTNTGNAAIKISAFSAHGAGLATSGPTTPATLNPSENLTVTASFAPTSAGNATGSITIVSDAANSSLTIPATGTGAQGELAISPTSYNFGSLVDGQTKSQAIRVTNTGSATLTIAQLSASGNGYSVSGLATPATIPAGGSATFNVLFAPTAAGTLPGAVSITSNAANSPSFLSLSGTGAAASVTLSPNPASLSFANVNAGVSSSKTVVISNGGNASLTISQISVNAKDFGVTGMAAPFTLSAGQSAAMSVSFKPTASENITGNITISSSGGASAVIPVSGSAVQPTLSTVPATITFGDVTEGSPASQTVQLANSGTGALSITQISVTGNGFSAGTLTLPANLTSGQSANFNLQFAPTAAGSASGSVTIVSNAPNSPATISLSGIGVAATQSLAISATNLAFGDVNAGASSTQSVTLTNSGNAKVTVSQITEAGSGFTLSGAGTPVSLSPGQSMAFGVIFSPSGAATASGSVTIASTATGFPKTIALSGTGVQTTPHSVTLSWGASSSSVSGYNVYRSTTNGSGYSRINSSLVAALSFQDDSVQAGSTYYYVVTAVNSSGEESTDSNQATALIP